MFLVGVIPLLVIAVAFYIYIIINFNNNNIKEQETKLNTYVEYINNQINSSVVLSDNLVSNSYILKNIKDSNKSDIYGIVDFYKMMDLFYESQFSNQLNNYNMAIYVDEATLPEGKYIRHMNRIIDKNIVRQLVDTGSSEIKWNSEIIYEDGYKYISFFRNIIYISKPIAILEVRIPLSRIESYFNAFSENVSVHYTTDADRILLSNITTEDIVLKRKLANNHQIEIGFSNINANQMILLGLMLTVLCITLVILGMISYSKRTTKLITSKLIQFVDELNNKDVYDISLENNLEPDEVIAIKQKFIYVICCLKESYQETNRMKEQKNAIEIEFLQQQINPHLLYNSLSALNWFFLDNNDKKGQEIISRLVSYYRAVLSMGNIAISIMQELELITDYIKIYASSYNKNIDLTINIADDVKQYFVLKLIIQPFVENSLKHGFENRNENLKVDIRVIKQDENILIIITDNGSGISKEKLEEINSFKSNGYGINNTYNRIRLYYGESSEISVESDSASKTTVCIKVKALEFNQLKKLIERK
jgi:two-component system sensor histidine kinase YesM